MKGLAEEIQCPTLIVDSENDKLLKDQAKKLYEELTCYNLYVLRSKLLEIANKNKRFTRIFSIPLEVHVAVPQQSIVKIIQD